MRRRCGIGLMIDRTTPDRAHRRGPCHAPQRAHRHARRSTQQHGMHLAHSPGRRFNRTPAPAPTLAVCRLPAARHARPNARPSPGAMRGTISAATHDKIGVTARPHDRARAIARRRPNRSSNAICVIASPIAHPSLPRRAFRSAHQCGLRNGCPSAHRNGHRSAQSNRNAAMWRAPFVTMTTTSAARSLIKPKPRPAPCACRSA